MSSRWYHRYYADIPFAQLLYHLFSPLEGTDTSFMNGFLKECVPLPLLVSIAYIFGFTYYEKHEEPYKNRKIWKFSYPIFVRVCLSLVCIITLIFGTYELYKAMGINVYLQNMNDTSDLYETYYVNPREVEYTFPNKKRNLIYIYLESMEVTFEDKTNGGFCDRNNIPELTRLQNENLTFNGTDANYNGYLVPTLNRWTIAGIVGTSSGLPMNIDWQLKNNLVDGDFLPNAWTMGDILDANGYYNEFMCGSDIVFGGRKNYLQTHGNYHFFDYYTAKEKQLIPEDYAVWWGYEDAKLFEFAKDELLEVASLNQPFNFNILTADTHYPNGYLCPDCPTTFSKQYSNVMACSSKRVAEFVKWIQEQDFYENTTIVISGDHTTMDTIWFEDVDTSDYTRKAFYTIINSPIEYENEVGRDICMYDLFPTTLASLGVTFESERLGFGTNLYTDKPTIVEEIGYADFDMKLSLQSDIYDDLFNGRTDLHVDVWQPPKGEEPKESVNTMKEDDFEKGEAPEVTTWQNTWPQFMIW